MKKVLLLAAFIYFFIAPLTFHPDNKQVLFWAGQEQGQVWNIWTYGQQHFPSGAQFNYPPLHFYLDKLQYWLARPLAGQGYDAWLATPNTSDPYQPQLARYAVATKFGLILFGLLVGYLIYRLAKQAQASEKQAVLAASFWLFNPIVIYSIPAMGQNDVMAVALFLIGWYWLQKSKVVASLLFGLAASVKMYPLLWLPFLLLNLPKFSFKSKLAVFGGSVVIYLLTLAPFISNSVFRQAVLGSDINNRFFIAQVGLGFDETINVVPILLLIAIFALVRKVQSSSSVSKSSTVTQAASSIMAVNLILLGFSHFHPQWFTWLVPFWALWLVFQNRQQFWLSLSISAVTFLAWAVVVLLFQDASVSHGMLISVNQSLANVPMLRELLMTKKIDALRYNNYAHTWLAGMGVLALAYLFSKQAEPTIDVAIDSKWQNQFFARVPKILRWAAALVVTAGMTFGLIFATYLVPAPLTSPAPVIKGYAPIAGSITTSFKGDYNNLSRIDLYFQNPDLRNRDDFLLTVANSQGAQIFQQTFSGFNTGYPSILRFDLIPQVDSKNQNYQLKLTPLASSSARVATESGKPTYQLEVGITDNNNHSSLAVMSYYVVPRGLRYALTSTFEKIRQLFWELPWLYIGLVVLLFLAV